MYWLYSLFTYQTREVEVISGDQLKCMDMLSHICYIGRMLSECKMKLTGIAIA